MKKSHQLHRVVSKLARSLGRCVADCEYVAGVAAEAALFPTPIVGAVRRDAANGSTVCIYFYASTVDPPELHLSDNSAWYQALDAIGGIFGGSTCHG